MRLRRATVRNFFGIEQAHLDLETPGLAVLVGANATGKSSVLKAIQFFVERYPYPSPAKWKDDKRGSPLFNTVSEFSCRRPGQEDGEISLVFELSEDERAFFLKWRLLGLLSHVLGALKAARASVGRNVTEDGRKTLECQCKTLDDIINELRLEPIALHHTEASVESLRSAINRVPAEELENENEFDTVRDPFSEDGFEPKEATNFWGKLESDLMNEHNKHTDSCPFAFLLFSLNTLPNDRDMAVFNQESFRVCVPLSKQEEEELSSLTTLIDQCKRGIESLESSFNGEQGTTSNEDSRRKRKEELEKKHQIAQSKLDQLGKRRDLASKGAFQDLGEQEKAVVVKAVTDHVQNSSTSPLDDSFVTDLQNNLAHALDFTVEETSALSKHLREFFHVTPIYLPEDKQVSRAGETDEGDSEDERSGNYSEAPGSKTDECSSEEENIRRKLIQQAWPFSDVPVKDRPFQLSDDLFFMEHFLKSWEPLYYSHSQRVYVPKTIYNGGQLDSRSKWAEFVRSLEKGGGPIFRRRLAIELPKWRRRRKGTCMDGQGLRVRCPATQQHCNSHAGSHPQSRHWRASSALPATRTLRLRFCRFAAGGLGSRRRWSP
eukprot:m.175709 g.175709  ORF g.175709 m.175709 type:complete len:605 (-) comp21364_c0_seq2:1945-3759(-)